MEPVERPVAAADGVLHVADRPRHVDAVGDARAVGDHEAGPGPRVGLEQRAHGLLLAGPERDLADEHVAVLPAGGPEVLLGDRLARGRELGDGAAGGGLGGLPAGVGVHLRVEHEHVHVAAAAPAGGRGRRSRCRRPSRRRRRPTCSSARARRRAVPAADPPSRWRSSSCSRSSMIRSRWPRTSASARWSAPQDRVREVPTHPVAELVEQAAGLGLVHLVAEAEPQPELGVVLEQRVGPRRAAALRVDAPRRRREVAAVDRRAARWRWPRPSDRRRAGSAGGGTASRHTRRRPRRTRTAARGAGCP